MIGFTDVGMMKFIQNTVILSPAYTGPKLTYAWAHPTVSRQALAFAQKQQDIGVPGVTIFRVGVSRNTDMYNKPLQTLGRPEQLLADQHTVNMLKSVPVLLRYKITVWTKSISDQNGIERTLCFGDAYKVINLEIPQPGLEYPFAIQMPVFDKDWEYEFEMNQETGQIIWYHMTKSYDVPSMCVVGDSAKRVESIVTNYQELVSGNPITYNDLQTITITPGFSL